jgi:uncharacterized protein YndB with AHSA1/START domain
MATDSSTADRELVITRAFDVPARFVFEAYTKPEYLKRWFGPGDWPLTMAEVDFRVGGRYRFCMTGPNGEHDQPFGGEYLEIVPNKRIKFTNAFEAPGSETMIMTVTLDETDGKTLLTLHTLFASKAMMDRYIGMGFKQGTEMGYDQLVPVLTEMAAR